MHKNIVKNLLTFISLKILTVYRHTGILVYRWARKKPTKKIKTNFKEEPKMCVYEMGNLRIVDLSKILDPKTESRRCHLFRFNTGGAIPDFHTNMDLMSHLGTHCECPYHHDDNWPSVAELPLTTFLGRAVYVDFKETVAKRGHITAADLDREAGKVREGDIVIIDSSYKLYPFTPDTNTDKDQRLLVGAESAEWFKAHKVKAVGFGDGVSIENCNEDVKPFHDILMAENIVFLEVLRNLEQLKKDVFFMSYSPLPILGLDSSPVRAYAIEGLAEFSE
jgi:arylformamidase